MKLGWRRLSHRRTHHPVTGLLREVHTPRPRTSGASIAREWLVLETASFGKGQEKHLTRQGWPLATRTNTTVQKAAAIQFQLHRRLARGGSSRWRRISYRDISHLASVVLTALIQQPRLAGAPIQWSAASNQSYCVILIPPACQFPGSFLCLASPGPLDGVMDDYRQGFAPRRTAD